MNRKEGQCNFLPSLLSGNISVGRTTNSIINAVGNNEGFQDVETQNVGLGNTILFIIIFCLVLALYLYIGQYLWNNMLVKVVTIFKPINSLTQLLGIMILINIMKL